MSSAWRYRCPRGHSNVESRKGDYYECVSCRQLYHGGPLDASEHDFPVDNVKDHEKDDCAEKLEVLGELVRRTEDDGWGLMARNIQAGVTSSVVQRLCQLRDDGFVKKDDTFHRTRWRPTESGRRLGGETEVDA